MTTLMILVGVIGAALTLAAVTYTHTRRSRKSKEPIQLGVDRKLRPQEFGNRRRRK